MAFSWIRGFIKKSTDTVRLRQLNLEKLEAREVPAATLMTNGALNSQAIFGYQSSDLHLGIFGFGSPNATLTNDIHRSKIDFNKDGYADSVQLFRTDETIGYNDDKNNPPSAASSRNGFIKVALGGPAGLNYLRSGTQQSSTGIYVQGAGSSLTVTDLNGDGYQDILALYASDPGKSNFGVRSVFVIYDPATSSFLPSQDGDAFAATSLIPVTSSANGVLGDVNGDGIPDLVYQRYDTANPVANPDVNSGYNSIYQLAGFDVFLGKVESTGPSSGKWIGNFQATPFSQVTLRTPSTDLGERFDSKTGDLAPSYLNPACALNTVLADFNGDGKLDLAVPEQDGISVFTNTGSGQFSAGSFFSTSGSKAMGLGLIAADFNGDGKPDLATTPNLPTQGLNSLVGGTYMDYLANPAPLSIFSNTTAGGAVSFSMSSVAAFSNNARGVFNGSIVAGDFNNDGNADLAVADGNRESINYGILEGDGAGGFGPLALFGGYSNSADGVVPTFQRTLNTLAAADIDNNGQLDIICTGTNLGVYNQASGLNNPAAGILGVSFNRTFVDPYFNPSTLTTATQGVAYSVQLPVAGGDSSKPFAFALNSNSAPLPTGLTLSSSGLLSGTPTRPGPYQLLVDVTQPAGPRSTTFVYLTVNPAQQGQLTISPPTLPNVSMYQVFSQQLSTAGGTGTIRYALSSGLLPGGLTLSGTGLISGAVTSTGTYTFTVSATDANGSTGFQQYTMVSTAVPQVPVMQAPCIVAGASAGGVATIFNADGTPRAQFRPFSAAFKGGVNVAQGDVTGDGVADLIVSVARGGGPIVSVFDGRGLALVKSFVAYTQSFTGGVSVAAGDVDGDGRAEVITGAGAGENSRVKVFNGTTGKLETGFFAFAQSYRGGITVAAGDVNGDGRAEIIAGTGRNSRSMVRVFNGSTGVLISSILPYAASFTGGVTVSAGDINGDGKADIVVGTAAGITGTVKVYSGADNSLLRTLTPYATGYIGGVSVSAADLNGDLKADVVTGTMQGNTRPVVKAFSGANYSQIDSFFAYSGLVGVSVAAR